MRGAQARQPYTTRQLLEALLMVSGNDAANMLADMLGGRPATVAAMTRKAASVGARNTGRLTIGPRRPRLKPSPPRTTLR